MAYPDQGVHGLGIPANLPIFFAMIDEHGGAASGDHAKSHPIANPYAF
jgi:hypothetical protein